MNSVHENIHSSLPAKPRGLGSVAHARLDACARFLQPGHRALTSRPPCSGHTDPLRREVHPLRHPQQGRPHQAMEGVGWPSRRRLPQRHVGYPRYCPQP